MKLPERGLADHGARVQRGGNPGSRGSLGEGIGIGLGDVAQPGSGVGRIDDERRRGQRFGAGSEEELAGPLERRVGAEEGSAARRLGGNGA